MAWLLVMVLLPDIVVLVTVALEAVRGAVALAAVAVGWTGESQRNNL